MWNSDGAHLKLILSASHILIKIFKKQNREKVLKKRKGIARHIFISIAITIISHVHLALCFTKYFNTH